MAEGETSTPRGARVGCLIAVAGLAAILAGTGVLAWALKRELEKRLVAERPLAFGEEAELAGAVATGRECQVAIVFTVQAPKEAMEGVTNAHSVPYRIPVRYRAEDSQGRVLAEETLEAQPGRGTRMVSEDQVAKDGGSARMRHFFAKFPAAGDGRVRVVARIDAPAGPVTASAPRLELFDNATTLLGVFQAGTAAVLAGLVVLIVGAAFWLGMRKRAERPA